MTLMKYLFPLLLLLSPMTAVAEQTATSGQVCRITTLEEAYQQATDNGITIILLSDNIEQVVIEELGAPPFPYTSMILFKLDDKGMLGIVNKDCLDGTSAPFTYRDFMTNVEKHNAGN